MHSYQSIKNLFSACYGVAGNKRAWEFLTSIYVYHNFFYRNELNPLESGKLSYRGSPLDELCDLLEIEYHLKRLQTAKLLLPLLQIMDESDINRLGKKAQLKFFYKLLETGFKKNIHVLCHYSPPDLTTLMSILLEVHTSSSKEEDIHIFDPYAGTGSLIACVYQRLKDSGFKRLSVSGNDINPLFTGIAKTVLYHLNLDIGGMRVRDSRRSPYPESVNYIISHLPFEPEEQIYLNPILKYIAATSNFKTAVLLVTKNQGLMISEFIRKHNTQCKFSSFVMTLPEGVTYDYEECSYLWVINKNTQIPADRLKNIDFADITVEKRRLLGNKNQWLSKSYIRRIGNANLKKSN